MSKKESELTTESTVALTDAARYVKAPSTAPASRLALWSTILDLIGSWLEAKTALAAADVDGDADLIPIWDDSASQMKKVTPDDLMNVTRVGSYVQPVNPAMSFWTRDAGTTNLPASYYGVDGRIACLKVTIPIRCTLQALALSVSALTGSGAVRYGIGIASLAGTVLASAVFAPTVNDLAPTLSANPSIAPGEYYLCFGGRQELTNLAGTFRRCFRPNWTNFKTGYTAVQYGYATEVISAGFVFPATLGVITTLADDTYYFPQIIIIGTD